MGSALRRLKKRNKAIQRLHEVAERPETVLIIHYSCESFYNCENGRTPRVTSIAVRNLGTGQTESFSIHKVAEQNHIPLTDIEAKYDELEKQMLDEFFSFVKRKDNHIWLHWNMRDINYGFIAIEHRYKVLGGIPEKIDENNKIDLARSLINIYGLAYIKHPRLVSLIEKNEISKLAFLTGEEEARAFEKKEFVKLHQSTLRKVDILANIFERTIDGTLKTNTKWYHIYNLELIGELIKEHWVFAIIIFVLTIIGTIFTVYGVIKS